MNSVLKALDKTFSGDFIKGARFLLALSGGLDSMVLLDALLKTLGHQAIICCHLNHLYRGAAADEDQAFVQEYCRARGLKLVIKEASMVDYAREKSISLEEAGRLLRRKFFESLKKEYECKRIVTAHHANDQAETFLMRLMRGSGLEGLGAIKPDDGSYLRPLLDVRRQEIEAYAKDYHIPYREDASNQDQAFLRNKIRLRLIPELEGYNPNIVETLVQTAARLQADAELLEDYSWDRFTALSQSFEGGVCLDRVGFLKEPEPMQRRLIRMAMDSMGMLKDFSGQQTAFFQETAMKSPGKKALWADVEMLVEGSLLRFRKISPKIRLEPTLLKMGTNDLGPFGKLILSDQDLRGSFNKNTVVFDRTCLTGPLFCRTRQEGDRFSPFGLSGTKLVSDYMIDEKVPLHERDQILIVEDKEDILWLAGHRRAAKAPLTATTSQYLIIIYEESK